MTHEDYQPKTDEELIDQIFQFGYGEMDFHTVDIERLLREKDSAIQALNELRLHPRLVSHNTKDAAISGEKTTYKSTIEVKSNDAPEFPEYHKLVTICDLFQLAATLSDEDRKKMLSRFSDSIDIYKASCNVTDTDYSLVKITCWKWSND